MSAIAKANNLTFTTFLDDIEFSSKDDFKNLIPEILQTIKEDGFYLNHKKISYKQKRPEVTGVIISDNGKLSVNAVIRNRAKTNQFVKAYIHRVKSTKKITCLVHDN